ncbi:unnamed protein product [Prunus armeniaca]
MTHTTTQESNLALSKSGTGLCKKSLWQLRISRKEPSGLLGNDLMRSSASCGQEPIGSETLDHPWNVEHLKYYFK